MNRGETSPKPLRKVYILDFYGRDENGNNSTLSSSSSGQQVNRLMSTMYNVSANERNEQVTRHSTNSDLPEMSSFGKMYHQCFRGEHEIIFGEHNKGTRPLPGDNTKNLKRPLQGISIDFTDYGILEDNGKEKKTEIHFVLSVTHTHFGKIETNPCHINLLKIREIFESKPLESILLYSLPTINLEKSETSRCFREKFVEKITKCLYSEQNEDYMDNDPSVLMSNHNNNISSSSLSSSEDVSFETEDELTSNSSGNNNSYQMDYTFDETGISGISSDRSNELSQPLLSPTNKFEDFLIQADMMWKTSA